MSKKDQIVQLLSQEIVEQIVKDRDIEYDIAMNDFYSSEVYSKLIDGETGLYLESAAYIYDLYIDERNFGHIVQAEI